MLLQTNSYIVPKEKRSEHARLLQRFRQTLARLGCEHFEAYEQVGQGWASGEPTGRFVQLMRFNDRAHQQAVQAAERSDPAAQALIREFCELINFPYQQEHGLFAVGFYRDIFSSEPERRIEAEPTLQLAGESQPTPQPQGQEALEQPMQSKPADFAAETDTAAAGDVADDPQQLVDEMISSEPTHQADADRDEDRPAPDRAFHP